MKGKSRLMSHSSNQFTDWLTEREKTKPEVGGGGKKSSQFIHFPIFLSQQIIKIIYGWIKLSYIKKIKRQNLSIFFMFFFYAAYFLCQRQHAILGRWKFNEIEREIVFFCADARQFFLFTRLGIIRWYLAWWYDRW